MRTRRNTFRRFETRIIVSILAGTVSLGACGCGKAPPIKGAVAKAPVSGVVRMGGEPLEGAEVYFYTDKFTGYGKTNAEGKFRLAQGAAIGPNKVFLSKTEGWNAIPIRSGTGDPVMALNDPGQVEAAALAGGMNQEEAQPKQLIPPEFVSHTSTKLSFDVPAGGASNASFDLLAKIR